MPTSSGGVLAYLYVWAIGAKKATHADIIACLKANPEAAGQVLLALESQYIAGEAAKYIARAERAERELATVTAEREEALRVSEERRSDLTLLRLLTKGGAGRLTTDEGVQAWAAIRVLEGERDTLCAKLAEVEKQLAWTATHEEWRAELESLRAQLAKAEQVVRGLAGKWEADLLTYTDPSPECVSAAVCLRLCLRELRIALRALDEDSGGSGAASQPVRTATEPHADSVPAAEGSDDAGTTSAAPAGETAPEPAGSSHDPPAAEATERCGAWLPAASKGCALPRGHAGIHDPWAHGEPDPEAPATRRGWDARYVTRAELVEALEKAARLGNINQVRENRMATKKKTSTKQTKSRKLYVIVRCRDAGVHAGEYVRHKDREVVLRNARRIWYWSGAASLSELAVYGAKNSDSCKFGVPVADITLLDACEIIATQPAGEKMIRECAEWRA